MDSHSQVDKWLWFGGTPHPGIRQLAVKVMVESNSLTTVVLTKVVDSAEVVEHSTFIFSRRFCHRLKFVFISTHIVKVVVDSTMSTGMAISCTLVFPNM